MRQKTFLAIFGGKEKDSRTIVGNSRREINIGEICMKYQLRKTQKKTEKGFRQFRGFRSKEEKIRRICEICMRF